MTEPVPDPEQPDIPETGPLSRTCPRCKAPPGQHCYTATKRPSKGWHAGRLAGKPIQVGRPYAITPALTEHITTQLANGTTIATAAQTAGIAETTLHRWLNLGTSDHPDHQKFREFREAVARARAQGNALMADNVVKAGFERVKARKAVINPITGELMRDDDGEILYDLTYEWDWKAHAWVMERAFREEWGKTQTLEITGDGGGPVQVEASFEAEAERAYRALTEQVERRALEAGDVGEVVDAEVVEESPPESV